VRYEPNASALASRIAAIAGDTTLQLADGTTITGPATVTGPTSNGVTTPLTVTVTAAGVTWTVPLDSVLAVGGAA